MRIKKYTAESMKEVLIQIRKDLGDNAMILKTRKIPRKLFALGGQPQIEVTAAVEDPGTAQVQPAFAPIKMSDGGVYGRPKPPPPEVPSYPLRTEKSDAGSDKLRVLELREDIREVKDLLKSILQTGETSAAGGFAGSWAILYKRLVDAEVNPALATDLVHSIKNSSDIPDGEVEKKFVSVLSSRIPVSGPMKQKEKGPLIVACVGPTGTGKTTTLAKLAAHCSIDKKLAVSIITADTYRIAAIEQIRTFADITGIGLQVVFSPAEVPAALEACENDDIVFVDTAGRSQKNTEHMREIEQFLAVLKPDETHLVLSATMKESDITDVVRRYSGCKVNRLLFTKLDETMRLGNVFNVIAVSGIEVSYFTMGQSVPDDIELARPGRFIQRLWEGSSI